ncbi:MAG: hypothetical protein K8U03_17665 [Planctomycetia bacterium]|nr:hypothetical protein [Planctomycetia bacterium]
MPHDIARSATPLPDAAGKAAPSRTSAHGWLSNRPLLAALLAFVATRIYFGLIFGAGTSDIGVYFDYVVQGVDFGLPPYFQKGVAPRYYRDIQNFEYPPVAYWVISLPRELSSWRLPINADGMDVEGMRMVDSKGKVLTVEEMKWVEYLKLKEEHYRHYADHFRIWMLLFDVAGFALFCAILQRRRPEFLYWGMWGYTLTTAFLGYVMFERLDVALTFALLAWAYCQLRAGEGGPKTVAWSAAAYAALGIGISFKLIPVLLVPFALLCDFYALLRPPRRWSLLVGPAVLVVTAAAPFAYYYVIAGDDLWRMFKFHSVRGVQIESSYATLMMLLEPASELFCYFDYGSWNLGGKLEQPMLVASTWTLLVALAALGLRSLLSPTIGETYDRTASYRMACVVIPFATLLAKVFSVQYLLWAMPMLLLGAAERFSRRGYIATIVLAVAACAMTGYLYPYHYLDHMVIFPYTHEHSAPWTLIVIGDNDGASGALTTELPRTLMIARNLIFAGLCGALYLLTLTRIEKAPAAGSAVAS